MTLEQELSELAKEFAAIYRKLGLNPSVLVSYEDKTGQWMFDQDVCGVWVGDRSLRDVLKKGIEMAEVERRRRILMLGGTP